MQHALAHFLEAATQVFGLGDVFLGVANDFAGAPLGLRGIVDPAGPFALVSQLDITFTQEE